MWSRLTLRASEWCVSSDTSSDTLQPRAVLGVGLTERLPWECGRRASVHRRQLGNAECQPLGAMASKVNLGACVLAAAFERDDHAFAELVVKHVLP